MNPIDKITDPTFTNSSKGLLTLFCIGLVHIVVGVDLTSTEIAIPWLPAINFPNTDRLPYLYWALVGFAMYRYTLHNFQVMREIYFKSLGRFLASNTSGKALIDKMMFSSDITRQVEVINGLESQPSIKISHFEYDGDPEHPDHDDRAWEVAVTFEFIFTNEYAFEKIIYSENNSYTIDELALRNKVVRDTWGLTEFINDYQELSYLTTKIKGPFLRNAIRLRAFHFYFKILVSSKDAFDLLIPLTLNAGLFAYAMCGI